MSSNRRSTRNVKEIYDDYEIDKTFNNIRKKYNKFCECLNQANIKLRHYQCPLIYKHSKTKKRKIFQQGSIFDKMFHLTDKSKLKSELNKLWNEYFNNIKTEENVKNDITKIAKKYQKFFGIA